MTDDAANRPSTADLPPGWQTDGANPGKIDTRGGRIVGLPTPAHSDEAATKAYVDDNAGGGVGGSQPSRRLRAAVLSHISPSGRANR